MLVRAIAAAIGLLGVVSPRTLLDWHARARLIGYENLDEVEPKGWLVALTRVVCGVLAVLALSGLARETDDR